VSIPPSTTPITLRPLDAAYPARLRALAAPPREITVEGDLAAAAPGASVAVVGTREPSPEAAQFAFDLAGALARARAVVVSGGALGIDAAAHRGALAAGGRTWAVAPSGRAHCFPKEHADLYREIARGPGAVVWPFPDELHALPGNFLRRNGVLVALSDAVVIVQAGAPSGTLNAGAWAKKLGRRLWAVPGPPWDPRFTGCRAAIDAGAEVVTSIDRFLHALELPSDQLPLPLDVARATGPRSALRAPRLPTPQVDDAAGRALVAACTAQPQHVDKIAEVARLCVTTALTRLLTLALENVLVEGPEGFYRRPE
jgi:DNA processing protein